MELPKTVDELPQQVVDEFRASSKRIAIAYGILCLVGSSVAIYVYMSYPHPALVWHSTKTPWSESIASYLFMPPIMLAIVCIAMWVQSIYWRQSISYSIDGALALKKLMPNLRGYYSDRLLKFVTIFFIAFGMLLFGLTIYHSWLVAAGGL